MYVEAFDKYYFNGIGIVILRGWLAHIHLKSIDRWIAVEMNTRTYNWWWLEFERPFLITLLSHHHLSAKEHVEETRPKVQSRGDVTNVKLES